jgi:hypothetical protein
MKNNTKIRLHLSKTLFENIAKEVLSEAKKANDGYSVAVKAPKKIKEVNAVAYTDKMEKMEEKMSSKEKMAKGLYKEDEMEEMQINVAEEGQVNEFAEQGQALITALATLLGVGVPIATSLYRDLKGKTPEEKKQVLRSLAGQMDKITGNDSSVGTKPEKELPKEAFSLNELRKQVKK